MDGRLKDIQRLIKKIDRLTDGQAYVNLENIDWDDVETLNSFLLVVKPNGGYYKGGKFEFRVCFISAHKSIFLSVFLSL